MLTVSVIKERGLLACRTLLATLLNTATGHMFAGQLIQVIPHLQVAPIGKSYLKLVPLAVLALQEQLDPRGRLARQAQQVQQFCTVLVIHKA
tara:strand:+ start:47 stop:322 length:276 start_codon:yes stop_codon:yes gene_type:complete